MGTFRLVVACRRNTQASRSSAHITVSLTHAPTSCVLAPLPHLFGNHALRLVQLKRLSSRASRHRRNWANLSFPRCPELLEPLHLRDLHYGAVRKPRTFNMSKQLFDNLDELIMDSPAIKSLNRLLSASRIEVGTVRGEPGSAITSNAPRICPGCTLCL